MQYFLVVILSLVALLQAGAETQQPTNYEPLIAACKSKLSTIETVDEFLNFLNLLEEYRNDDLTPQSSMKRCMAEYDSLMALRSVFGPESSADVCHPSRVNAIVDYYQKQLVSRFDVSSMVNKRRMARHFVRRYALQVALICRQNLVANLEEANNGINSDDFNAVFLWRNKQQKPSQTDDSGSVQEVDRLFSSITSIDQVVAMMQSSAASSVTRHDPNVDQLLHEAEGEPMTKMRGVCGRLSSYYQNAVMSIVSLASVGYAWNGYKLKEQEPSSDEQRQLVSNWLASTVICDSLLTYEPLTGEKVHYHEFQRNHLNASKLFEITKKYVDDFAVSKAKVFVNKWSMKMAHNVEKMVSSMASGKHGHGNAVLAKIAKSMLNSSGDQMVLSPQKDSENRFGILMIIILVVLVGTLFGLVKIVG